MKLSFDSFHASGLECKSRSGLMYVSVMGVVRSNHSQDVTSPKKRQAPGGLDLFFRSYKRPCSVYILNWGKYWHIQQKEDEQMNMHIVPHRQDTKTVHVVQTI